MNTQHPPRLTVGLRCAPRGALPSALRRVKPPVTLPPNKFSIVDASAVVGKGVVLFTMFYSGLNWLMYRNARIKSEDPEK